MKCMNRVWNMMTSSNGNIFRVTGPLCGEFTGPGEIPTQRPVTRSFDVFFDRRLNKRLSKQPRGWWLETLSCSLWRQSNEYDKTSIKIWHLKSIGDPGAHFTNNFAITIQMWWKFHFALIQVLIKWSLQNLAHGTTAWLSWHVPNFVAIWLIVIELELN